jgi:hypothetical protein
MPMRYAAIGRLAQDKVQFTTPDNARKNGSYGPQGIKAAWRAKPLEAAAGSPGVM